MMSKYKMAIGLPNIVEPKEICTGCLMSKQTRKPFPFQTSYVAKRALELIHGDLCGPMSPETARGNRYFSYLLMTIVECCGCMY